MRHSTGAVVHTMPCDTVFSLPYRQAEVVYAALHKEFLKWSSTNAPRTFSIPGIATLENFIGVSKLSVEHIVQPPTRDNYVMGDCYLADYLLNPDKPSVKIYVTYHIRTELPV